MFFYIVSSPTGYSEKMTFRNIIMKKIILITLAFTAITINTFSQNQSSIIKTQAMDMARALLRKDYSTFSKYMHPRVAEMAGGRNKIIEKMDSANSMATKFGAEIKKILIGNPGDVLKFNGELQAALPQTTELKTNFGSLSLETTLIAISTDKGKSWYFIDTSVYNVKDVKKSLPNLSPDLVIPPTKPPKFTPNQ
jgi:hypothetical protein